MSEPLQFNRWCRAASVGKETASFHPVKIESPHHARAMRAQGIEISFPNGIQIRGIRAEDGELLERLVRKPLIIPPIPNKIIALMLSPL